MKAFENGLGNGEKLEKGFGIPGCFYVIRLGGHYGR